MTMLFSNISFGQIKTLKEINKERKELRSKIKEKALKKARKEAKRLSKREGWRNLPGDLPLDKMIETSWMKMYEMRMNDDGSESNAYIWASQSSVAGSKSAAKTSAIAKAMQDLGTQLNSHVSALTKRNMANIESDAYDAETLEEVISSAKIITSASLNKVKPIVVMYRTSIPKKELKKNGKQQIKHGKVEVQVILFYDLYQVDIQTRKAIVEELKNKVNQNEGELNKIMGLDVVKTAAPR